MKYFSIHNVSSLRATVLFIFLILRISQYSSGEAFPDMVAVGPNVVIPEALGFRTFVPPVDASLSISSEAPIIAEWTRSSEPGDTMVLTGEMLTSFSSAKEQGRDTRFVLYGEGVPVQDAAVRRLNGRQCAITLPESLPPDDMYLLWPANSSGFGAPVAINKTEAWWVGLDEVSPGESFSVYGRNLSLGGKSTHLYIENYGWIRSISQNPYKADFICPDLSVGSHVIYAHNGHGDKYGWSTQKILKVVPHLQWSDDISTWVNVKDFGAKGDGVADDASAISSAYETIKNGDLKTLYFPAGTYLLGAEFLMNGSGSVRIKGENMDVTTIKPSRLLHPYKMLNIRSDHTRVEDISIESGGFGLLHHEPLFNVERCSDIRFTRMRLVQTNATSQVEDHFQALYADHLYFKDCEFFTARSVYFSFSEDIIIDRCQWFGVHDCNNMLGMETTRAAVFDCSSRMMDNSDPSNGNGWAKGRWIAGGVRGWNNFYVGTSKTTNMAPRIATPFMESVPIRQSEDVLYYDDENDAMDVWRRTLYFSSLPRPNVEVGSVKVQLINPVSGKNRSYDVVSYDQTSNTVVFDYFNWEAPYVPKNLPFMCSVVDNVDQNSSEQILFEGGNTSFRGVVTAGTANSVSIQNYSQNHESTDYGYVTIVDGRGVGQQRAILSNNENTIYVKEEWRVVPDTSSRVVVGRFCDRFVVYNNDLDGVDRDAYSASVGFQITGGGHSIVVDQNRFSETRTGIANYAESQEYWNDENTVNPVFFGTYQNNTLRSNKDGVLSVFGIRPTSGDNYPKDLALLGNVFRRNSFSNVKDTAFLIRAQVNDHVGLQVLADSDFTSVKDGIIETENSSGLICVGNTFIGTGTGIGYAFPNDSTPLLRNNTWQSFGQTFSGNVPGGILEIPYRYIRMSSDGANIILENSGTSSLSWNASQNSSWLLMENPTGSVADERGVATLSIALKSGAAVPQEGVEAIVTITSGDQSRQITVVYDSASGESTGSQQRYELTGFGNATFRVEIQDGPTERIEYYSIPQNSEEVVIEDWMVGEWSRVRIQINEGDSWRTIHEEWMGQSLRDLTQ
ncbi:glycosyl hydrolase family 28-related protein [Pontiellaceae bacterium B12219]|nr:glycosyl hydrolase family 28-related protein [Pontiellaceae bacterium B12219]